MKSRWIFLGLLGGAAAGIAANLAFGGDPRLSWAVRNLAEPIGLLFLRLIFLIVPLLAFSALALGIAGFRDLGKLGRIFLKTTAYTVIASSLAVGLGLFLVNVLQPGLGVPEETRQGLLALARPEGPSPSQEPPGAFPRLVQLVPDPLRWLGSDGILALLGAAILSGLVLGRFEPTRVGAVLRLLERLFSFSAKWIALAMMIAPFGIFCLVFKIAASFGFELLGRLAAFGGIVLLGLAFHQFVTYSLILRFAAGTSPREFFARIKEVMATAFATSSSNATLPTALRVGEENLKLPPHISRFVLTAGATANQNGTALYEGVTILFLAQLYLGHHLPLADQLYVLGMAILAGVGTAGVPSGSIPFIALICEAIGVPKEGVGVILGLDRILDMCRTVLNVSGDLVCATYVARSEEGKAQRAA